MLGVSDVTGVKVNMQCVYMCACCWFKSATGNHKSIHFNLTSLLLFTVDNINYGVPNRHSQQCPSMGTNLVEGLVFCLRRGSGPLQCPTLNLLFFCVANKTLHG